MGKYEHILLRLYFHRYSSCMSKELCSILWIYLAPETILNVQQRTGVVVIILKKDVFCLFFILNRTRSNMKETQMVQILHHMPKIINSALSSISKIYYIRSMLKLEELYRGSFKLINFLYFLLLFTYLP